MTLASTILDTAMVLGHDPPPSLPAAHAGLLAVDRELGAIGLRLALVGADAEPMQVPHWMLVRRAIEVATADGRGSSAALARLLHMAKSAITKLSQDDDATLGHGEIGLARAATILHYLLGTHSLPASGEQAPPLRHGRPYRRMPIDDVVDDACQAFGHPASDMDDVAVRVDLELDALGLRLAVIGASEPAMQIPHALLVRAAVERAEKRGETKVRARLARLLGIDRAVITGMFNGARSAFGGGDSRARVELLLDHLRDHVAHPLPPRGEIPGRPMKKRR
jgi:hypothetical protein